MLLGKVTDTQDTTGTVLEEHLVEVTEEQVKEAVFLLQGNTCRFRRCILH